MKYEQVNFPLLLINDHLEMNIREVSTYLEWFKIVKRDRLNYFCTKVLSDKQISFTKNKLQACQYFLENNLLTSVKTSNEIREERNKLPIAIKHIHKIKEYKFIEPSFSIIFDLSIYFGEFIKDKLPEINWYIEKKMKMAQYGYPILKYSNSNYYLAPQWVIETFAIKVIENGVKENDLVRLAEFWEESLRKEIKKHGL